MRIEVMQEFLFPDFALTNFNAINEESCVMHVGAPIVLAPQSDLAGVSYENSPLCLCSTGKA
jgi:hypothetical protein